MGNSKVTNCSFINISNFSFYLPKNSIFFYNNLIYAQNEQFFDLLMLSMFFLDHVSCVDIKKVFASLKDSKYATKERSFSFVLAEKQNN